MFAEVLLCLTWRDTHAIWGYDLAVLSQMGSGLFPVVPCERDTPRDAILWRILGGKLIKYVLVLEIPDLHGDVCGRDKLMILARYGHNMELDSTRILSNRVGHHQSDRTGL